MKLRQKLAISYAIQERKEKKQRDFLKSINEYENYKKSKYKTMTGYINMLYNSGYISEIPLY